jgi:hypothetical protein
MQGCSDVEMLIARSQIFLAAFFSVAVFALVFVLIFFHSQMSALGLTLITSTVSVLLTILTLQMNFFYARQRSSGLPDPSTPLTPIPLSTPPPELKK